MNTVFSIEDLSDPIWAAAAESLTVAEQGLGMSRSQSEWAFQRFLEEIAASGSPMSSSSATGNPIGKTSPLQSQPSVSRQEDVDGEHLIETQKPQNHDYNPNHLLHSDDSGNRVQKPQIHDRIFEYLHNTDDKGNRNHASPSAPAAFPIDSDQYRAILKSKLDLACAAAVALRAANVKPELSGASADHQKPPEISGSQAQGSLIAQTSPSASSASIPTVPTSQRKTDALVRQTSGSSRDDSDDEEFEGDTETTDNLDPADIKRARRMLSNRESARRSRRRKQEQMTELETQAGQLRAEHSSLLKRLSDMNHKYDTAAVDNRILKADIETLRTKVKMAEDTVKRMTGMNPLLMARPTMPNATVHIENVPADSTRVSAVPSANHTLKSSVPNILPHEPIPRVQNNFSSSGRVPPSAKLARGSRIENLTNNPQHVVSADNLQKQVTNSGTRDHVASGMKPSEVMSGRIHDVTENNQRQR